MFEQKFFEQKVIISNEKRVDKIVSLEVKDAFVYYEGIKIANIDKISFMFLLFYNEINIDNIKLLDSLSVIIPPSIKNINIKHSIFDYKNIHIKSIGSFGKLEANVNILTKKVLIKLDASSLMKREYSKILRSMKLIDGKYIWEKSL